MRAKWSWAVGPLLFLWPSLACAEPSPVPPAEAEDGDILYEPPPFLTSVAAPAKPTVAVGNGDLRWLEGLVLPDFPVRWDARVVEFLEYYRNDAAGQRHMRAWLKKSNIYRAMVRTKLREAGLPEDLMYVAMVESGFDPTVRSPAGAMGLWQFVERTGSDYGLSVTRWVDTRRDPERATEAAAKFLSMLRKRLGSWELALAAYNMGLTGLERSMAKYNTNDYWLLARLEAGLPYETTQYVAKIMACAIVGRNPARFGYADVALDAPLTFDTVDVPAGSLLSTIARAAGTDTATVKSLNPSLRRDRTPTDTGMTVRIPAGSKDSFARAWSRLRRNDIEHQPHVVRFGETIASIAKMYRTKPSTLAELNELPADGRLSAGLRLMVPAVTPVEPKGSGEVPVVAIPEGEFVYPGRRRVFYEVTEVDTLERIADFFRVTPDDLRLWNQIAPDAPLHRGLMLQLFVKPDVDLSQAIVLNENSVNVLTVGSKEFFEYHEAQRDRVRIRYTVKEKDTIESIAKRFDLSVGSVGRINAFGRHHKLKWVKTW
ncbi:MAG: transglycosylase SLT domain-containing protein [Polyangiales bacterium]